MAIIVQKFGGTSVANIERIKAVAQIIKTTKQRQHQVVVVVSAMSGATQLLLSQCQLLAPAAKSSGQLREYDVAIASGEIVTAALLALHLQTIGIKAVSMQGWQVPLITNTAFGNARVIEAPTQHLKQLLAQDIVPVITGFQGVDQHNNITTLGFGGSDTSAAILAAALQAQCDIYTDVDGIYSADPRIVSQARHITKLDFELLYALCAGGAKVVHPRAALIAKRYKVPMRILSSFSAKNNTVITNYSIFMEQPQITAITTDQNLLKLEIIPVTTIAKILQYFAKEKIVIKHFDANGPKNVITIILSLYERHKCQSLLDKLQTDQLITTYQLQTDICMLNLVGYALKSQVELFYQVVDLLTDNAIPISSINYSDVALSLIIQDLHHIKAVQILHEHYFK